MSNHDFFSELRSRFPPKKRQPSYIFTTSSLTFRRGLGKSKKRGSLPLNLRRHEQNSHLVLPKKHYNVFNLFQFKQIIDTVRYVWGPLPETVCSLQLSIKNIIFTQQVPQMNALSHIVTITFGHVGGNIINYP